MARARLSLEVDVEAASDAVDALTEAAKGESLEMLAGYDVLVSAVLTGQGPRVFPYEGPKNLRVLAVRSTSVTGSRC